MTDTGWTDLIGARAATLLARSRFARRVSDVAVLLAATAVVVTQLVGSSLEASIAVTLPAVVFVAGTTWSLTTEAQAAQAAGVHLGLTPYAARTLGLRDRADLRRSLVQAHALTDAADPGAAARLAPVPLAMRLARVVSLVDALALAGAVVVATVAFHGRHPALETARDRYAMVGLLFLALVLAATSACAAVGAHRLTTGLGRLLAPVPLALLGFEALGLQLGATIEHRAVPVGWVGVAALAAPAILVALPGSRRWYADARRAAGRPAAADVPGPAVRAGEHAGAPSVVSPS